MSYTTDFMRLKCAGDVLNIAGPMKAPDKEISESMAVIRHLKSIALKEPMQWTLYDMCAGNALTSLIAVHLLPFKKAIAVDKRERYRKWENAKRFTYLNYDIKKIKNNLKLWQKSDVPEKAIIIGVHACQSLANDIIDIYNKSDASHLILMPCCIGQITISVPDFFRERLGKYWIWTWQLSQRCEGKVSIHEDKKILSPCNAIITASKF